MVDKLDEWYFKPLREGDADMAAEDGFTREATIAFFDVVGRAARQIPDEHRDSFIGRIAEMLDKAYESTPDIREDVERLHTRFVSALVDPA